MAAKVNLPRKFLKIAFLLHLIQLRFGATRGVLGAARHKECDADAECGAVWPNAVCRKSRCACRPDSIRRATESGAWVCVSLFDVVTGQLGPPLTCPLPDGAGFRVILKSAEEKIVFCNFHSTNFRSTGCPPTHECIKSIGTFSDQWNGVCCQKREFACDSLPELDASGYLERWYFDGVKCQRFQWNPEATISPNTFLSAEHCESYCRRAAGASKPPPAAAAVAALAHEEVVVLRIEH